MTQDNTKMVNQITMEGEYISVTPFVEQNKIRLLFANTNMHFFCFVGKELAIQLSQMLNLSLEEIQKYQEEHGTQSQTTDELPTS